MKKSSYSLILILMALPVGLIIGLQIATIKKQFENNAENFDLNVNNAAIEVNQVLAGWMSHTSNKDDKDSYQSLYTNSDNTFSVLIAQSAQQYPLLDFEPDTILPRIRAEQFRRFQKELEETRRKENKRLKEVYVLRSIQYCADCEEENYSIAEVFPLDSLIRVKLEDNNISTETQIGFYDKNEGKYGYLSAEADSVRLSQSKFKFTVLEGEKMHIYFPDKKWVIWKSLLGTITSFLGLAAIAIASSLVSINMLSRQRKLTEMKNDFINNVTHEFKTPLATIDFALANIENDKALSNPAIIKQFTKVIRDENKRLNSQVEKILQAGMAGKEGIELERTEVNVHAVIRNLSEAYSLRIGQSDTFELQLKAQQFVIEGDLFHLSNAVSNLIDNAIKYSSEPRQILIETFNTQDHIQIKVSDNGLGISSEAKKFIFEKFYRIPTGNLHNTKGFGLGLSYVKAILEGHNGDVVVESQIGEGSSFTIILPLKYERA